MQTKCYFDRTGSLIHIGEWDLGIVPARIIPAVLDDTGKIVKPGTSIAEQTTNPIPDGATFEMREIVVTAHGKFLADDHASLRRMEYPPIGDQLDALWKGGSDAEEMRARVQSVKEKYPKSK